MSTHVENYMESEEESESRLSFKQRAEKSTGGDVVLMQWSPKMDVIALAFSNHSVVLNRLSWQRVWSVEPAEVPVTALAWRPDGKVLAVGYANGRIVQYYIENGQQCHTLKLGSCNISSLLWIEEIPPNETPDYVWERPYKDNSGQFLQPLPSIENNEESLGKSVEINNNYPEDPKHIKTLSNALNILFAGDKLGNVHVCLSGVLHITSISLNSSNEVQCHVIDMCVSSDFRHLAVLVSNDSNSLHLKLFNMAIFAEKSNEFHYLTLKNSQIISVVEYINETLKYMSDCWEDSLLTVDRQLEKYAKTLPSHLTIVDEFILLLACGKARSELQTFLVNELTANGIKKIGLSLELSYQSLQRYVINHINRAVQTLSFHLHDILGVAKWTDLFGSLGLLPTAVQDCIQSLGNFALKAQELLFVIDESLQNLKVFCLWLYTTILKLSGEPVPSFIKQGPSPDELKMIIDFLKKRLQYSGRGQTFSLERVGQYLMNEDLKIIEETPPTLWEKILADCNITRDIAPWLLERQPQKSLTQLYQSLSTIINNSFQTPHTILEQQINKVTTVQLHDDYSFISSSSWQQLMGLFHHDENYFTYFPVTEEDIAILQCTNNGDLEVGQLFISNVSGLDLSDDIETRCQTLCLRYYNSEALSLIFSCSHSTETNSYNILAQLPMTVITSLATNVVSSDQLISTSLTTLSKQDIGPELTEVTNLGRFQSKILAVSGPRRLAAVVSTGGKRILLFDVDVEEEDEDLNTEDD